MIVCEERIGRHRLILGDCLAVMPELGSVTHIITDPPYEASVHASKRKAKPDLRTDGGNVLRPLDFAAIDSIRQAFVARAAAMCDGWFLAFCTPEGVARWADAINPSAMKYKRACIWIKPDATPQMNGQVPAQGAEMFVAAWAGKGHSRRNAGGKRGVYTHNTNPPDRHGKHPTEKPWRLMAELLVDFTLPGDVVCDPFMGSGTTILACQKTGRQGIGIEQDPKYFEMACERVAKAVQDMESQADLFAAQHAPRMRQGIMTL